MGTDRKYPLPWKFSDTKLGRRSAKEHAHVLSRGMGRMLNRYAVVTQDMEGLKRGDVIWFAPSWGIDRYGFPLFPVEASESPATKRSGTTLGIEILAPAVSVWINKGIDTESPDEWLLYMWDRAGYDAPVGLEDAVAKETEGQEINFGEFTLDYLAKVLERCAFVKYAPRHGIKGIFDSPEDDTKNDLTTVRPAWLTDAIHRIVEDSEASNKHTFKGLLSPEEEKKLYPFGDINDKSWGAYNSQERFEDYVESLKPEEREAAWKRWEEWGQRMNKSFADSYNDPRNRPGDPLWTGD